MNRTADMSTKQILEYITNKNAQDQKNKRDILQIQNDFFEQLQTNNDFMIDVYKKLQKINYQNGLNLEWAKLEKSIFKPKDLPTRPKVKITETKILNAINKAVSKDHKKEAVKRMKNRIKTKITEGLIKKYSKNKIK